MRKLKRRMLTPVFRNEFVRVYQAFKEGKRDSRKRLTSGPHRWYPFET